MDKKFFAVAGMVTLLMTAATANATTMVTESESNDTFATGQNVGSVYLPSQATGGAMTYMVDGVQYVAIAVGGNIDGKNQAQFMAFRLPQSR